MNKLLTESARQLMARGTVVSVWAATFLWSATATPAAQIQQLGGHVPAVVARLKIVDRLPVSKRLHLVLGLPLRNPEALATLLQQIYDPASAKFRQYLTPGEFTGMFGPTEKDYQTLIDFAQSNGFTVEGRHPNRTLLDVSGSVGDIERAFHVTLGVYQHPTEARTFYAPDTEPSLDLAIPVLRISGLDDLVPAHPNHRVELIDQAKPKSNIGSAPGGDYMGNDFRAAYVPGVALNGAGQTVALMALAGYYMNDITAYESQAGLPNVPILNIAVNGVNVNSPYGDVVEASLDIEMVISMAPGISQLRVYEGLNQHDVFNRIATDNVAKQISSSYVQGPATDPMTDQIFIQFAMQGQSCFVASGDGGALSSVAGYPLTSPYVTLVGGTVLTTSGPGGAWVSETAWSGGQGGVSFTDQIPWWQKGVNLSGNQGSATMRNVPDVALTASGVYVIANNGTNTGPVGGTSCAAPLWAGFMALVNQQAVAVGRPPVGFINPAIYAIGRSPFHDITTGNNTNTTSPNAFFAVAGYDLCTGWGTPNGISLINSLVGFAGAVWVQFGNSDPGNGTYTRPYNTLAQGTNAVPSGRTIAIIGPGSTPERMAISKPMTLQAVGGPAIIGR